MKKGDLSMGVIIGAAIALLILVLLSVLIFRAGGAVVTGTSCSATDGFICAHESESCSEYNIGDDRYVSNPGATCSNEDEKCCVPFGG